jgi:hypothetical protein
MFVVGSDSESNDLVRQEAVTYKDIMMIDTFEIYENLIYKNLAMFEWTQKYCQNALFVTKIDDNIVVNTKSFLTKPIYTIKLEMSSLRRMGFFIALSRMLQPGAEIILFNGLLI